MPCAGQTSSRAVTTPNTTTTATMAANARRRAREGGCRLAAAPWLVLNLMPSDGGRAAHKSPAEDIYARPLVWPARRPEALIALVRPDQHDGIQSGPGKSYHFAYAMDPHR